MPGSSSTVVVIDDDDEEQRPQNSAMKQRRWRADDDDDDVVVIEDYDEADDCQITGFFRKRNKRVGVKRPAASASRTRLDSWSTRGEKSRKKPRQLSKQEKRGESLAGGFIAERDKVKESHQFKQADEEEWQRRQVEVQRQAQEMQRLKKRKREKVERQLAMEARQKERVAEIRKNQSEEMKNHGLKDVIRGNFQAHLERKAAGCKDMRTLLCCLGIAVEGGVQCTPEQVNAAYKKALLRFHPDRAAANNNNDPQLQVEAEETFKLISRMKTILRPLVSR